MKHKQFLEQLSLYLDGEIAPADAAELEQEILSNPARRRIYNDYCRIHRATKLVYEQFRAAGAANDAGALPPAHTLASAEAVDKTFTLGGRTGGRAAVRPFRRVAFAGGLAAACAFGVFIGARALAPRTPETLASTPTVDVAEPAAAAPVLAAAPASKPPATFAAPFAPDARPDPFVQFAATRTDPFALTPWTVVGDFASEPPPSMSNPPVLRIDPRFRPVSLDSWTESQTVRENRPFRLRVGTETTTTVPSTFGAQP